MKLFKLPILLGVILLSGCNTTENNHTGDDPSEIYRTLASSKNALIELAADKICDASFQCKVLAIGERPCGGPSQYVVYSTESLSTSKAEFLAREITSAEHFANKEQSALNCQPVIKPSTLCIKRKCEIIK